MVLFFEESFLALSTYFDTLDILDLVERASAEGLA
jgi:hypothetical protein